MFQFVSIRIYRSSVGACGCFICFMGANVLRVQLNSGAGRCKAPPICYRSVMDYGDPICDSQRSPGPSVFCRFIDAFPAALALILHSVDIVILS